MPTAKKKQPWALAFEQTLTDNGLSAAEFCRLAKISPTMWCRWLQGIAPSKYEDQHKALRTLMVRGIQVTELVAKTLEFGGKGAEAMRRLIQEGHVMSPANERKTNKRLAILEVAMNHQVLKREAMSKYHLRENPFRRPRRNGEIVMHDTLRRFKDDVIHAIKNSDSIIAITGRPGSGKSTLKWIIANELSSDKHGGAHIIMPDVLESGDLNVNALQTAIIQKLAAKNERAAINGDAQAKSAKVIEVLTNKRGLAGLIIIMIDESHRLTKRTIDALKVLNDATYMGLGKLVHIVLIGQTTLNNEIHDPSNDQFEIRTEFMPMPQLSDGWAYLVARFRNAGCSEDEISRVWPADTVTALKAQFGIMHRSGQLTAIYVENIAAAMMNYSAKSNRDKILPAVIEEVLDEVGSSE